MNERDTNNKKQTVTLPWIPIISPKLRKVYRKAGYKVVFKSGKSIMDISTSRNKTKLPVNSHPGVYKIPCSCGIAPYRGETKKRISTRVREHQRNIDRKEWDKSAVALHSRNCDGNIDFENIGCFTKTMETLSEKSQLNREDPIEVL